jgi:hypothetical protein
MRPGTAKVNTGVRLPAEAALEPLREDPRSWKAVPLAVAPQMSKLDVPLTSLTDS